MTKPKEKFLFDDDLLEEMPQKKEIEDKILKSILMWAIFYPSGDISMSTIKITAIQAWVNAFSLGRFGSEEGCKIIASLELEGYQCRQIKIKALKK